MQLYVKVLLTTPGTDIWNPELGGGLYDLVAATTDVARTKELIGDVVVACRTAGEQILSMQSKRNNIPIEERLLAVEVPEAKFDVASGTIIVSPRIISKAQKEGMVNISV